MATLDNYKGLQVVTPDPSGAGGLAINNDFKSLVDWHPRCNWSATADPTKDDDDRESSPENNYQVGSLWFNEDTGALFLCVDATEGAAVWRGIPFGAIGLTAWQTTTDGSAKQLFLNGVDEAIVVPTDTAWAFTVTVVARRTDTGSNSAAWEIKGAIKRDGSGVTLLGTNDSSDWKDGGASGWLLSVTAGASNDLKIEATGATGETIEWSANIRVKPLAV